MANQEQLALLKQGSTVWYAWRKQHPSLQPDLSNTKLNEETLITKEQIGQAKPGTNA